MSKSSILPEKAKTQPVAFLKDEPAVRYHFAAKRCGDLSVWCAAMAGAAIAAKKTELGHGKFNAWKKTLPYSMRTAENYVALAKALDLRIRALSKTEKAGLFPAIRKAQDEASQSLALLGLPDPMDVFNPAHDRIATLIRELTNERTLSQLYFDWDIVKGPKQRGGARPHGTRATPAEQAEADRREAEQFWHVHMAHLAIMGLQERTWLNLSKKSREKLIDLQTQLNHLLRESL